MLLINGGANFKFLTIFLQSFTLISLCMHLKTNASFIYIEIM